MEAAAGKATMEEHRRKRTQADLQNRYQLDLEREKMVSEPCSVDTNIEETSKKSTLSSTAPASCVFDSGASADGGADGPEVQWAGAVPAARQGVRGHVPPTAGGLRGWEAGQTGWGGHAQTAGQVHQLTPVCVRFACLLSPLSECVCCVSEWCVFVSCDGLVSCAGCIPASHKVTSWISN